MREESTQGCRPSNVVVDKIRLKVQDGADVTDDLKASCLNADEDVCSESKQASKVVQTVYDDLEFGEVERVREYIYIYIWIEVGKRYVDLFRYLRLQRLG